MLIHAGSNMLQGTPSSGTSAASQPASQPGRPQTGHTDTLTHLQEACAGAAPEAVQQGCHDCREVVSLLGH